MSAEQAHELATSAAAAALADKDESATEVTPRARQQCEHGLNLAAHPRATRRIAECKAWGGLAGFCIGGYLSLSSNTLLDAAFRALLTGIVCYVAVWGAAVFLWRRLIVAELRQHEYELSNELARRAERSGAPRDGDSDMAPVTS